MMDLMLLTPATTEKEMSYNNYVFVAGENDIQFDKIGRLVMIDSVPKTIQEINKILLSDAGSHPEDERYGTILGSLIGEKLTYQIKNIIVNEIINAIDFLNEQNNDNPDLDAFITDLLSVDIRPSDNLNVILVDTYIRLESGKTIGVGLTLWS
jgi:hypothetical protein